MGFVVVDGVVVDGLWWWVGFVVVDGVCGGGLGLWWCEVVWARTGLGGYRRTWLTDVAAVRYALDVYHIREQRRCWNPSAVTPAGCRQLLIHYSTVSCHAVLGDHMKV